LGSLAPAVNNRHCSTNASLLKVHTRTVDVGGGAMERMSPISSNRSVPTVASESLTGSALVRGHGLDEPAACPCLHNQ